MNDMYIFWWCFVCVCVRCFFMRSAEAGRFFVLECVWREIFYDNSGSAEALKQSARIETSLTFVGEFQSLFQTILDRLVLGSFKVLNLF